MKPKIIPLYFVLIFISLVLPQPAHTENITIEKILKNPDEFDGKNISVTGTMHATYDGPYIYDEKGNQLWLGTIATDVDINDIHENYGIESHVDGVYKKPTPELSQFGFSEGLITQIKKIGPLSKDAFGSPIAYELKAILEVDGKRSAMLTDLRYGRGSKVESGINIRGVLPKKIISIEGDRIVVEEKCTPCNGNKVRHIDMFLEK